MVNGISIRLSIEMNAGQLAALSPSVVAELARLSSACVGLQAVCGKNQLDVQHAQQMQLVAAYAYCLEQGYQVLKGEDGNFCVVDPRKLPTDERNELEKAAV